jgi:hypothetical protein
MEFNLLAIFFILSLPPFTVKKAMANSVLYAGWGSQSWTVFCGPAAAVGGCEQKDD